MSQSEKGKGISLGTEKIGEIEANSIGKFDEWFRYVETIGQQRLGGYLFTASITLAAFATLYSRQVFLLSFVIALFGMIFSFLWTVIGTRQGKFHEKMEAQIDRWLAEWNKQNENATNKQNIEQFPIWHVRNMKKDLEDQKGPKLNWLEQALRTRRFLWMVPSLLLIVYIFCASFALRRFFIE